MFVDSTGGEKQKQSHKSAIDVNLDGEVGN